MKFIPFLLPLIIIAYISLRFFLGIKKQTISPIVENALLSTEEIKKHAVELAKIHETSRGGSRYRYIIKRLENNFIASRNLYRLLMDSTKNDVPLVPSAEWLLDNFYVIEEQFKEAHRGITPRFLKLLPSLSGAYKGLPRIYSICLEMVFHRDGKITEDLILDFLRSYQNRRGLLMSEIWALSSMLSLALFERIGEISRESIEIQQKWNEIESLKSKNKLLDSYLSYINEMKTVDYYYIEHLLKVFKRDEEDITNIMESLEKRLSDLGTTTEKVINIAHQEEARLQNSMGNCISSLRLISKFDWYKIFESLSIVEEILREDPSGYYPLSDKETRSYYRSHIESLSKCIGVSEILITRRILELSNNAQKNGDELRKTHVGYYILSSGKKLLLSRLGASSYSCKDSYKNPGVYVLPITILTLFGALIISTLIAKEKLLPFLFILLPLSEVSVSIVNWFITHTKKPTLVPKLELKGELKDELSTIIIVPALLSSLKRAEEILKGIEITYMANGGKNIYFAIVGDLIDSKDEKLPTDDLIIEKTNCLIKELNKRYSYDKDIFYLFIRRRSYSSTQKKWMGWERKRGAIMEFNCLLKGNTTTSFSIISGDVSELKHIKYVITLDADTLLPIGEAKKLIGAISHPLNVPVLDEKSRTVVKGYGLIQPRIGVNIESSTSSIFSSIFSGGGGIDSYTNAISDVYQDIFDEGIFTGKGIYDVDIFIKALKNSLPGESILSHDLIEGSYVRTALASDIQLIDGYPSNYISYMLRLHRWVRGDWQLLPWLFSKTRDENENKVKNPLSSLSKWKIFDNLRRSLISPSILMLIAMGFLILPGSYIIWTIIGLICLAFPILLGFLDYLLLRYNLFPGQKLSLNGGYSFKFHLYHALLLFSFLPYSSYMMLDAAIRSLYRVYISRENLLEWVTAADADKQVKSGLKYYFYKMRLGIFVTLLMNLIVLLIKPNNFIPLIILSLPWFISPVLANFIGKRTEIKKEALSPMDISAIRKIARKTWAFYEDTAGIKDNYLPIDNYQEEPIERRAHRTSPTNIGFLLMATLSAWDMGYITFSKLLDKIDKTLTTVESLEKWHGHLYNWYDTKNLNVLHPKYVSTVDSGNLIGYCITLLQGLKSLKNKELLDKKTLIGLFDTASVSKSSDDNSILNIKEYESIPSLYALLKDNIEQLSMVESERVVKSITDIINEIELFFPDFLLRSDYKDLDAKEQDIIKNIYLCPSLNALINEYEKLIIKLDKALNYKKIQELQGCIAGIKSKIEFLDNIIERLESLIMATEFTPLYDFSKGLFSIGYNADEGRLTNSYYDLFASEARLSSYIAVTKREVPPSHWFNLGRSMVSTCYGSSLVSWTGTIFEYLMPPLIMKNYRGTLLNQSYFGVIRSQIDYGDKRKVPWGTSESGYYAFDFDFNYQYRAFGVPELGLKRGLSRDMVVSPYSTILALPFSPLEAAKNIRKLELLGLKGYYGLYEAIDFTPQRVLSSNGYEIVKSYMAHHQGMIIVAINNYINNEIMVKRFHSHPMIMAGEFLLQERPPILSKIIKEEKEIIEPLSINRSIVSIKPRVIEEMKCIIPECSLLSNGAYTTLIDSSGCGYSKIKDVQITRWREDLTSRNYGMFFFIRNLSTDEIWSTTYCPYIKEPSKYKVIFSQDKAEYLRVDDDIETHSQICISPEDNCEIRKIQIFNHSKEDVEIECTSYFEIVITHFSSDVAHPAFSNLFVTTEAHIETDTLIASRRPREPKGNKVWVFHRVLGDENSNKYMEYETDRYKFIGRGKDLNNPLALFNPLSSSTGSVLDPIMSIRKRVKISAEKSITITYITGYSEDYKNALETSRKYGDFKMVERAFEMSYLRSHMEAKYLNLKSKEVKLFEEMLGQIIYLSPNKRNYKDIISKNQNGQQGLWPYGISGDLPIILVTIKNKDNIEDIKTMLKAHEYWRTKGLYVDLVILNEEEGSYFQHLMDLIKDTALSLFGRERIDTRGGIFIKNASVMPRADRILFYSAAKIIIATGTKSIASQIDLSKYTSFFNPSSKAIRPLEATLSLNNEENLKFFNGYGGFNVEENEYVIKLKNSIMTPLPWSNIISNKKFGFIITETGSGYVWSDNSRENKLTPWSNDPIKDSFGEVIYIREDLTGDFWSITPGPIRQNVNYTIRHGIGYSSYSHISHDIYQELTTFVPEKQGIKLSIIKLKNTDKEIKKLSIYYYARPVLGVSEELTNPYIISDTIDNDNILITKNPYNTEFPERILFMGSSLATKGFTGDRNEFIGIYGNIEAPLALKKETLSNTVGIGLNPCLLIKNTIEIHPEEEMEFILMLGEERSKEEVLETVEKYRILDNTINEFNRVKNSWRSIIDTLKVKTPDASMNLMLNSWLLYQNLSCRIWGRSAFYQSGGAFGFRDQLQDVLGILHILPETAKKQILLHSSHQFIEGDVLHWWHSGLRERGIRTKFSDDLLWLPYATSLYIEKTGDTSILLEVRNYLEDAPLSEKEDERYGVPEISKYSSNLYEHCKRAIDKSLKFGEHLIPLMGSGDWNDGMNTVGNKGKGESVWLGWFLYSTLIKFLPLCKIMKDDEAYERYSSFSKQILEGIEKNAWDGEWYIRAYSDNGTPLGSSKNSECKIDSLAQSWAIISHGGDKKRSEKAMESLDKYLVKRDNSMILLFTPPFDSGELQPGYIKGYVPGVRENGGQYTHAAIWVVYAYALMGDGNKAVELFNMLNPINHSRTPLEAKKYKAEPYVMAADVYAIEPHTGRGGWTWYTGSASWMYKVGIESILGFQKLGDKILINPCIPMDWKEYSMIYKYFSSTYHITVKNPKGVSKGIKEFLIDSNKESGNTVVLRDDGKEHYVEVIMG